MARTIKEIYDGIIAEKESLGTLTALQPEPDNAQTLLSDLTSTSKVALWRLWYWVVAVAIQAHELVFDQHKLDVEARVLELLPATDRWIYDQVLAFQYGDALVWLDNKYKYTTIDTSLQIVKRCAVLELNNKVYIKVAKLVSDVPAPLAAAEETALDGYLDKVLPDGMQYVLVNETADLLKIAYTVYYNPLLLDATGTLLSDGSTKPVEVALLTYIRDLKFNGVMYLESIDDAVQAATGVVTMNRTTTEAKYGALPYSAVSVQYQSNAGYLDIDPAFPLSTQITYIPAS